MLGGHPDGVRVHPEIIMKTSRLIGVPALVAAAAVLAGCASTQTAVTEPQAGRYYVDGNYVHAVERAARSRGVTVHWINAPEHRQGAQRTGD